MNPKFVRSQSSYGVDENNNHSNDNYNNYQSNHYNTLGATFSNHSNKSNPSDTNQENNNELRFIGIGGDGMGGIHYGNNRDEFPNDNYNNNNNNNNHRFNFNMPNPQNPDVLRMPDPDELPATYNPLQVI